MRVEDVRRVVLGECGEGGEFFLPWGEARLGVDCGCEVQPGGYEVWGVSRDTVFSTSSI
jgi:hypothetical protein